LSLAGAVNEYERQLESTMTTSKTTTTKKPAAETPEPSEVKKVEEAVTETVETAVAMTKEKVEEMQEKYAKAYEDFTALSQENFESFVKAGDIFTKGFETISKAYFDFAKTTAESGVEATKAMIAAKTLKDMVEVQTDYAKSSFDMFVAEGPKFGEMSVKVANEAFEPIKSQFEANVEKVMKAA
jgi:phasin family protein